MRMDRFWSHFCDGTQATATFGQIGAEIETIMLDADGWPITPEASRLMREKLASGGPAGVRYVGLDLSRATHELAIGPAGNWDELWELITGGLAWLYQVAAEFGASPHHGPNFRNWRRSLLEVSTDPRDLVWQELDGLQALGQLTCASVQFTVDVNPSDAANVLSRLWLSGLHEFDFKVNDARWRGYIKTSRAGYRPDRYGWPAELQDGVPSIEAYLAALLRHDVVMHEGQPLHRSPLDVAGLDIDLFLRSVWWHYRIRRYGDKLCIEIRPFSRRTDAHIVTCWKEVARVLGY